jgi:hypothetical protein
MCEPRKRVKFVHSESQDEPGSYQADVTIPGGHRYVSAYAWPVSDLGSAVMNGHRIISNGQFGQYGEPSLVRFFYTTTVESAVVAFEVITDQMYDSPVWEVYSDSE